MSVFIMNFQSPKELDEFKWYYENFGCTNIDILINDSINEKETIWSVPSYSEMGDIVIFACASTAKDHMGHVCAQAKAAGDKKIVALAEEERKKYRYYSKKIIAIGKLGEMPWPDLEFGERAYSAKIINLKILDNPIDLSDFKGDIVLNTFNSFTKLNSWQWELIKKKMEKGEKVG